MPANTVEATLTSKYIDGISRGVDSTKRAMQQALTQMSDAAGAFANAVQSGSARAAAAFSAFTGRLRQQSDEADGNVRKIGFATIAMGFAVAQGFLYAAKSLGSWLIQLTSESSELTALKLTHEAIAKAAGWQADSLERLRAATRGLVADSELLKNSNRVLQSNVRITDQAYVELTQNVYRLAKANRVDAAQAMGALNDSLIKGNVSGLAAVGVHLSVKNAVSQLSIALGESSGHTRTAAKDQAFLNDMLAATRRAVAALPPDVVTLADTLKRAQATWQRMVESFGEGIVKSQVLQQLLQRVNEEIDTLTSKKTDVDQIALATNQFFIGALRGAKTLLEAAGLLSDVFDSLAGVARALVGIAGVALLTITLSVRSTLMLVQALAAQLPGALGRVFRDMLDESADMLGAQMEMWKEFAKSIGTAFGDFGERRARLNAMADSAAQLAADMEKYAQGVLKSADGLKRQGSAAADTSEQHKKLNDQMKRYADLQRELAGRAANPEQKILQQFEENMRRIDALTLIGEERRNQLRLNALRVYFQERERLEREALDKLQAMEEERLSIYQRVTATDAEKSLGGAQGTLDTLSGAAGRRTDEDARKVKADADRARREEFERIQAAARTSRERNMPQWQQELAQMHIELQKLNQIGMDPFHQIIGGMKGAVIDFAGQAGQAIASFFADLVSGQEGAGRKLLAAFIGMIGQMLVKTGVLLIQSGVAEIALASTVVGRFMGASHAAGVRAIATGAILSASGGILIGAASGLAQTNQASPGSTFQQNVPRPTSGQQVQVINVGAAGRSQSQGEAIKPKQEQTVRIMLDRGLVASEVKREINRNGSLRVAIQNA